MSPNAKHLEFIRLVSRGIQQEDAYRTTIGNKNTTSGSARSQASKLCKRYAKEIATAKEKAASIIEHANKTKEAEKALKLILTQSQVDAELCNIIKGESYVEKLFVINGKLQKTNSKPDHTDKLKAIDLYNKRFGSNAPVKQDLNVSEIKAPIIVLASDDNTGNN